VEYGWQLGWQHTARYTARCPSHGGRPMIRHYIKEPFARAGRLQICPVSPGVCWHDLRALRGVGRLVYELFSARRIQWRT